MFLLFLIIKHKTFEVKWMLLSVSCIKRLRLGPQEIRKYWKYHKNGRRQCLVSSLPSIYKNLVLVVKNFAKTDFKVFLSCPILLEFLTLFHKFCPRLYKPFPNSNETNAETQLGPCQISVMEPFSEIVSQNVPSSMFDRV